MQYNLRRKGEDEKLQEIWSMLENAIRKADLITKKANRKDTKYVEGCRKDAQIKRDLRMKIQQKNSKKVSRSKKRTFKNEQIQRLEDSSKNEEIRNLYQEVKKNKTGYQRTGTSECEEKSFMGRIF